MPGKPFRSSLEPHFDEIAQRRTRRETWAGIAAALEKAHGLKVHFTAVQKFFGRHLAGRPRPLGFDPLPTATASAAVAPPPAASLDAAESLGYGGPAHPDDENPFLMRRRQAQHAPPNGEQAAPFTDAQTPAPARKEYVFIPKPKRPSRFSDEDLQFNDPLAIDTFGKPVPENPDVENPFKMRKRKTS